MLSLNASRRLLLGGQRAQSFALAVALVAATSALSSGTCTPSPAPQQGVSPRAAQAPAEAPPLAAKRKREALPPPTAPVSAIDAQPDASANDGSVDLPESGSAVLPEGPIALTPRAPGRRSVHGQHGVVVSVEAQATRAGVEILKRGGNAVDAAVAVGYALAVTHPSAGNIGGGGFMMVRPPRGTTVAVDFREAAPAALTHERFKALLEAGVKKEATVGVPGSVAGLNLALRRFGTLPLATVLEPAIALARDGYRIGARQAATIGWNWSKLRHDPAALAEFGTAEGKPRTVGTRHRRPDLAATLQRIAEQGDSGFYMGKTARALVAAVREGGLMTLDDLSLYRAKLRTPLEVDYRDLTVQIMPPASAGGVAVVQTLLMLERLGAHKLPRTSAARLHLLAETARRAHAERRFRVADPEALGAEELRKRVQQWTTATPWLDSHPVAPEGITRSDTLTPLYGQLTKEPEHTTHYAVVDSDGMVVSCTVTLSSGFGARIVAPGTGVVLNNTIMAFGFVGDNIARPGRRPTSSMAPTLVLEHGETILALGSPGGDTIPNTIVQVLSNIVDYGMPLDQAVDAGRIHHGFVPDELRYEGARPPSKHTLAQLKRYGHVFSNLRIRIGDANSLLLSHDDAWGYADPREGGLALAAPTPKAPPPDASDAG